MTYVRKGVYAALRCIDCEWSTVTMWIQRPYPGNNGGTLYECDLCRAVISLAELTDWMEFAP